MAPFAACCLMAAFMASGCMAATPDEWRQRSIYQVMTDRFARTDGSTTAPCDTGSELYCGGTYQGIIDHLDYIQGLGFSAIWISPVIYQIQGSVNGEAYHGYWGQDYYGTNRNFGLPSDLVNLSDELHRRGMYLMVDVTPGNMAYEGSSDEINYGYLQPFNNEHFFHTPCLTNYTNQTSIEECWQSIAANALPDLRTEDTDVATELNTWVKQLVANYSIDGIRVDATNHMGKDFLSSFHEAAGVYTIGEVYQGNPSYSCGYQGSPVDGVTDYNSYFPLIRAFNKTQGPIQPLVDMITYNKDFCSDTSLLGTFSENHDEFRFAFFTGDLALARNILAYTMLSDGIPIVWQGQEQHYAGLGGGGTPYNREAVWLSGYDTDAPLYKWVAYMNQLRFHQVTVDTGYLKWQQVVLYHDNSTIALRKGSDNLQMITVLSNLGENGAEYTLDIPDTGFQPGLSVIEVVDCTALSINEGGDVDVPMQSGAPRILLPTYKLQGSGICGY